MKSFEWQKGHFVNVEYISHWAFCEDEISPELTLAGVKKCYIVLAINDSAYGIDDIKRVRAFLLSILEGQELRYTNPLDRYEIYLHNKQRAENKKGVATE